MSGRAGLLAHLIAARGRMVPYAEAMAAAEAASRAVLRMQIMRLRDAGWAIETRHGIGLQLDPSAPPGLARGQQSEARR